MYGFADEVNDKLEIDISLSPKDYLFDVSNMKPGDWAPRELTIKNNGKKDFFYQMSISNEGDVKLFNELILEVEDQASIIYNGKLKDFDKLSDRMLAAGNSENITLTLRFPEHLGNAFQGLSTSFKVIFVAEGTENPSDPEDPGNSDKDPEKDADHVDGVINDGNSKGGSQLPNTSTNMYNFLFIGVALLVTGGLILLISKRRRSTHITKT